MPLNLVSNSAANVAHRNLSNTDMQATSSLAKLSIGKRVVSARDDAASLAIGSRINSEVQGLRQAVVNAGQANSMLQIADGAMSTVSDVLTRMKSLAIQSSSGNLSATERGFLDTEFQALISEVDRVADDTDFAGTKLLDGSYTITATGTFVATSGVASITAEGIGDANASAASGAAFTMSYTSATGTFQMSHASFGTYSGSISTDAYTGSGSTANLTRSTVVQLDGQGTAAGSITVALNTAYVMTAAHANASQGVTGNSQLTLDFKLGTGTAAEDSLSFSLDSINASSLGITGRDITSAGTADAALEAVNNAIDTLNEYRADVGAAQNRLDFSSNNLRVQIENAEAARSTLLDLDVASEITNFTSKQVLLQSGTAMLAQANQLPQNLLRLLQ